MIVADTNLIAYAFVRGPFRPLARAVLRKDDEWVAPSLWRSELLNTLAQYLRRGDFDGGHLLALYRDAEDLIADREIDPDPGDVVRLIETTPCAAYDCEFAAVAQALGLPLVTSDKRLLAAFPGLAVSLAEYAAAA